jgi:acetolactate synthase regulatory subunit
MLPEFSIEVNKHGFDSEYDLVATFTHNSNQRQIVITVDSDTSSDDLMNKIEQAILADLKEIDDQESTQESN